MAWQVAGMSVPGGRNEETISWQEGGEKMHGGEGQKEPGERTEGDHQAELFEFETAGEQRQMHITKKVPGPAFVRLVATFHHGEVSANLG